MHFLHAFFNRSLSQVYKFRRMGYSVDYFVDFSVTTDLKNSSWRILDLDQPGLGMSREYLIKGLEDEDVQVFLIICCHENQ